MSTYTTAAAAGGMLLKREQVQRQTDDVDENQTDAETSHSRRPCFSLGLACSVTKQKKRDTLTLL
jgi:hypothetical protein